MGVEQLSLKKRFDLFDLAAGRQISDFVDLQYTYKGSACTNYMFAKITQTHSFLLEVK